MIPTWGELTFREKPLWELKCPDSRAVAFCPNAVVVACDTKISSVTIEQGETLWEKSLPAQPVDWGLAVDRTGRAALAFGVWVVAGGGSPLKVLREPMVGATILGLLFMSQGWQTPVWMTNTLKLLGQIAIPLMLITLGVAVARLHPRGLGRAVVLSVLKIALCIAIAWAAGRWFALGPVPFAVLVLQLSTPVAVTSYLIAEKYGAEADHVAGLVVVSTLLSVVTIPLALAVLI